MWKALLKKQIMELFRHTFVHPKTGKARSKKSLFFLLLAFVFLVALIGFSLFSMGVGLGNILFDLGLGWFYFAIFGIFSVLMGVVGSVFQTYSSIYLAKDNETLVSMPIPPRTIVFARLCSVYLSSALYTAAVWIPALVAYGWLTAAEGAAGVICGTLLFPFLVLAVTALTCVFGYLVARIAVRLKNKSVLITLIALVAFLLYYVVVFNLSGLLSVLEDNPALTGRIAGNIRIFGFLFYWLGRGAEGHIGFALLFMLVAVAAFALCFFLLSKSFLRMVTVRRGNRRLAGPAKEQKPAGMRAALLRREWRRLIASPTYMLNCGMGNLFVILIPVIVLLRGSALREMLDALIVGVPELAPLIGALGVITICMCSGMNMIAAPSVSLEGKNIWILQSLPVPAKEVMFAKLALHVLCNAVFAIPAAAVMAAFFGADVLSMILLVALTGLYVVFTAVFDLSVGILLPNLNWTTEAIPIKQSLPAFLSLLAGWVAVLPIPLLLWFAGPLLGAPICLLILLAFYGVIDLLLFRFLMTGGAKRFAAL